MTDQQPVTEGAVADERAATGERESLTQYGTRIALRASWIAGIVSALLVLILNAGRNPIPMLDDARSFGAIGLYFIVPAAFFVTAIAFVMGVNAWNERVAAERQRGWKIAIVPTAIAYTVLTGIVAIVMLQLAEPAFPFLALDRFQAAFVVGLVSAALIFWLTTQAIQITSGHLLHIANRGQIPSDPVLDHLGQAPNIACNHRHTAGHSLKRHQTETLGLTGQQQQVGCLQQLRHAIHHTGKGHPIRDPKLAGKLHSQTRIRPITDHDQPCV